ncbi:MAG: N-6 DNA methylase, partial [Chloroflexota bacterium]|nr:N-6 DNA methylase [Chloroflexota bacterium]
DQGNHIGLPLRILDPACGSGSFLLGAYQLLLDHHLNWYMAHRDEKGMQNRIYESATGWRLTTAEKKRILLAHIFGVDIDRQAVEVTKLSLLLKVLEGENQETLGKQLALFKERALPNLDANIRCGNSLIGTDYFAGHLMPDADELRRINPFDWAREFPDAMRAGGFDVVIGNPPWGADFDATEQDCVREYYAVGRNSNLDSYAVFMERAIKLLKLNGMLGYITPDTFLRKDDHLPTRKFLFGENTVEELIEAGPLFSKVRDTWCLITTIAKAKPSEEHTIKHRKISRFVVSVERRLEKFGKGDLDSEERVRQSVWMQRPNLVVGYRASETEQRIVAK